MKYIDVYAATGSRVIIFLNQITHIYSMGATRTMIKMNNEGVLTNMSINDVMDLIKVAER